METPNPSPSLSNLPATALDGILEDIDVKTVQILRKVCHSLRSHIDNTTSHIDSNLNEVIVRAIPSGHLRMKVNTANEEHDIQYEQKGAHCEVTFDENSKIIENEDFASMAANDLALILKHQKSEMESFALQFPRHPDGRAECMGTYQGRFLTGLEPFLRSRKTRLSTFEFVMRGTNQQNLLLKVLPYLDPEYLNRIEITTTKNTDQEPSPILKINEIVELDQWKNAKEVYISLLKLDVPLENFFHFSKAEFEIQSVSAKELTRLKERILKDAKFEDFKIEYHQLKDKKKLLESFGRQFAGSTSEKRIWYHKFPTQKKRALYIAWREKQKVFKFYSISLQNVPDNGFN